jgi:hypothetical protein
MKHLALTLVMLSALSSAAVAEEAADKVDLKDGSTLFLHDDGTSRMVDAHGKAMTMTDGVEMETASGDLLIMMNKKIWKRYGPVGKGRRVLEND